MPSGSDRMNRASFGRAAASGRRFSGAFLTLAASPSKGASASTYAAVISKKVAPKAVDRNLLRRRLFSILRRSHTQGAFIVYAKKGALERSFAELEEELNPLLAAASAYLRAGGHSGRMGQ